MASSKEAAVEGHNPPCGCDDMRQTENSPAGLCPHCQYPMDPGRCPECGKAVADAELLTATGQMKRRKHRRRVCMAILLALAAASCWIIYATPSRWICYVPSRALLPFCTNGYSPTGRELLYRYQTGQLSAREANGLFDRVLRIGLHQPRSPRPIELPIAIRGALYCDIWDYVSLNTGPYPGFRVQSGEWLATIDGVKGSRQPAPDKDKSSAWLRYQFPQLAVGQHRIDIEQQVCILPSSSGGYTPLAHLPYSTNMTSSVEVVVENRPLSDYIKPTWSDSMQNDARQCLLLDVRSTSATTTSISMIITPVNFRLAAAVWVRFQRDHPFTRMDRPVWTDGTMRASWSHDKENEGEDGAIERIDLCLLPDRREAFESGLDDFFSGVIEWHDIPVAAEADEVERWLPTSVRQWGGETQP